MRVAVDLRPLLEPFESGVSVYTRSMVEEFLRVAGKDSLELDLFYQARKRCDRLHEIFSGKNGRPAVRHVPISTFWHRVKCVFGLPFLGFSRRFPRLSEDYFEKRPDLIWLPDRREFFRTEFHDKDEILRKIPVVMTVHDLVPEKFGRTLSWKGRILHLLFPLKRLLKFCDGIVVPSSTTGAGVRKYWKGKMDVTFEGAKLAEGEMIPAALREVKIGTKKSLKSLLKRDFFLMIAPADSRKRGEWMLAAARRFPKVNFVWAGVKESDSRFAWCRVLKQARKLENVFLLGRVTEEEKLWLLRKTKALLALSAYEGFDLPVLEAVRAKCPVIMSDIAVHHELYFGAKSKFSSGKSKKGGACFVENEDDLIFAIKKMISQKSGCVKVPRPRGDYTWEGAAKRTLHLFRKIISS
jgi:glycosyltransferase involved in cell wall biosynthesis